MNWSVLVMLALIFAAIGVSIVATTWIRAKHGYPLENADGTTSTKLADTNAKLEAENKELKQQVSQLLERVSVLERIATDPAERTAREIEALRDVPLAIDREEKTR
jgi:cell division protein FtsB